MSKEQKAVEKEIAADDLETKETEGTEAAESTEEGAKTEGQEAQPENAGEEKSPEAVTEEEANQKYLRLMADFQNYKRRTEKDKSDIYAYANEKLVSELLDVIDNFERALAHGEGDEGFVQGMNNIFKIFKGVLEKSGLEEIEAMGIEFDPNFHNAVMTEESSEYESGHITQVLQKGYKLNGKVIRPSMVKVAN
ncbi:nucleotide exchange factor GrpE [Aminipila luticellarii]|uniref:Protein GrpE n=1 Tax=Aminipila luticellarii TaxID=2507160 RepID=A0A410PUS7_9FIRM|nr:nucleotide exchange factor GrpE [Aminipila luticellarii]QAT42664.1 nucleotide exchange factor GrpE [Aminipila luticellarii]